MLNRRKTMGQNAKRLSLLVLIISVGPAASFSYNQESLEDVSTDEPLFETVYTLPSPSKSFTEIPGGLLLGGGGPAKILDKAGSPYLVLDDWIVERGAELRIEPGVELRFKPTVGLTVRGRLLAVGTEEERITFTSDEPGSGVVDRDVRLVDGPSPTAGRLQILHLGSWRSICSNSRNWTLSDFGTVCRSLGYRGGRFYRWFEAEQRSPGLDRRQPRLLLERPECTGAERSLVDCRRWAARQLGAGVCDFHGDVGVECERRHGLDNNGKVRNNWRGVRFEHADSERRLTQDNTLYITTSRSVLRHCDLVHGGSGRAANATAALSVRGVAPLMHAVRVLNSAHHGAEVLDTDAPLVMTNSELRGNAGYGLLVNSTYGQVLLENCTIYGNGADGVRHIVHDVDPRELRRDRTDVHEFCTLPTTVSQTYPVRISIEQSKYANSERDCGKYFTTRQGYVLTLNFVYFTTDKNDSATLEVFDGTSRHDKQLASFFVRNNTRAQRVTSTRNKIYVRFKSDSRVEVLGFLHLTAGKSKTYDLNVTRSDVADNNGKGITVENLRSSVHIHQSSISNNGYTAGLHVLRGVGDVNITESRISFNKGDGVNITYTGGNRNISRSSLSSNTRRGLAVWLNDTAETEYIHFNQTTVVEYSEVFRNLEEGILHGNFCGQGWINITGNWFNESLDTSIDLGTCWRDKQDGKKLNLQIGHNVFERNRRISIKIYPALNIDGKIEYNHIRHGEYGGILIKNQPFEEFEVLPSRIVLQNNELYNNKGVFVVNLGTSPYSIVQSVLFTRNFVTENVIREPFINEDGASFNLLPRSRVAAPVVVSSGTVDVFRNIIDNPDSKYEIGSHLEDQSKIINCTYNWLGKRDEEVIFHRLFHRKDRYNLAKIIYLPYLLHNSNPGANTIVVHSTYVPQFNVPGSGIVGGEVDGQETLKPGEYIVDKDINIRPGGKLRLQSGVTLKFPPSVGIMVAGKLEARGRNINAITMTLKQQTLMEQEVANMEMDTERYDTETQIIEVESKIPIRLLGGMTSNEGRLQVKIGTEWGTVCNYGWTMRNAALVCHQLGLVLNPDDWNLERNQIPNAGTSERIIMANVRCTEFDNDITQCRSEKGDDFENSCTHEHDVGVRCYQSHWAGMRLGVLAERADLQFITIEKAGLLDYATNAFQPALQIDFARHNLESIRITDNLQDGLGIVYSDIYTDAVNIIRNSEFLNNRGSGISLKQLGLKVQNAMIEDNLVAGIKHDPVISGLQQKELAGWFNMAPDFNVLESGYHPINVPEYEPQTIDLETGLTRYLLTSRHVSQENIHKFYDIRCQPGYVIGIQLLNPISNRSSEQIWIHDSQNVNSLNEKWLLNRDLSVFPAASSSFGVVLEYTSGEKALGGVVLVLSTIQAPRQTIMNKIVRGPVPTLSILNTRIRRNTKGIQAWYYNRYLNEVGDHYLRKANESIKITNCEISHNLQEAFDVYSPFWDIHESNISEITISINSTLITDNGRGIMQFSRDMRNSNNLFHYILQDNSIERNQAGGFEVSLPYVWDYNENFTHSIYVNNNTWRGNKQFSFIVDGHYSAVNLSRNSFTDNVCKTGLISIRGMEKQMKIDDNVIQRNNGKYMVEFRADSQSEILGEVKAVFIFNEIKSNRFVKHTKSDIHQLYRDPTCVVGFNGVQKVRVNRNLFSGNVLDYDLLAGIKTAKINSLLDVRENWWGSDNATVIKKRIFDFDDWNNHAVAHFRPFLIEDNFDASVSVSFEEPTPMDLDNLGGRLMENFVLYKREKPYVLQSDLTVMPDVKLTIHPGVEMEFAPNVGILVLGTLDAQGLRGSEILMRPMTIGTHFDNRVGRRSMRIIEFDEAGRQISKVIERSSNAEDLDVDVFSAVVPDKNQRMMDDTAISKNRRSLESLILHDTIRLCSGGNCSDSEEHGFTAQGFLEYYNKTTLQWVPMCDDRFTERNAQVVCRELGFDPINVFYQRDRRIEYHSNSLSRIWSWPEPLQCKGTESRYDDCPIRLNGQLYGHLHTCSWDSEFVFISCGRRNLDQPADYWGGVRFAHPEFEHRLYEHRVHDVRTHGVVRPSESVMEFVKIIGAGVLHNEKSPAIQSIVRSPSLGFVDIIKSAHHGLNLVSPSSSMDIRFLNVNQTLGDGINVVSLTGEGRESDESSFTPLKELNLPHSLFSLIDICDTAKEIIVEERVLVYYKYENSPVNCVKIFRSAYGVKPFGFRLLQFNLFNRTTAQDYGRPDEITLYDGDVYNVSAPILGRIKANAEGADRKFYRSTWQGLSVKLFASGASGTYGFVAEIVTLPISAIGFNRDAQHNVTHSTLTRCLTGALSYSAVGEVSPTLSLDRNQITDNCVQLYGNFSTCKAAMRLDVQNMQNMYFRNNLVQGNQGGLWLRADSRGSATSLRGWLHNNLFTENLNLPTLYVEGRQSSPYQEVTIYRNYFTRNNLQYHDVIVLKQVVSNFSYNYVNSNRGARIMEISGFEKVRLPIYQTTTHNGFYNNYAVDPLGRATIVAGTAGQQYVDNIFFNPDNDYEMITVNRSITLELWKTKIDAAHNYWGYNTTLAVGSRVRDRADDPALVEVQYRPLHNTNATVLDGKCPPGWGALQDTCYAYIGAPMGFREARAFCRNDNASMPYLRSDWSSLRTFMDEHRGQAGDPGSFGSEDQRVWVQDLDRVDQCTAFEYGGVVLDDCQARHGFLCEIDPIVVIDPLLWTNDIVAIGVISSMALAVLVLAMAVCCWYSKSRHRHAQRLQRRNSIRQSLRSLNSLDPGSMRRKNLSGSRSTDTLTVKTASDCKRMLTTSGSLDSIEKSVFTGSSLDDDRSFDVYEAHNPRTAYTGLNSPSGDGGGNSNMFGAETKQRAYGANEFRDKNKDYEKPRYYGGGGGEPRANNAAGSGPGYELAFRNEGYRDASSTFGAGKGLNDRARHHLDDSLERNAGQSDYYNNTSTLPLNSTMDKSIAESESLNLSQYSDHGLPFYKDAPHGGGKMAPPPEYSTFRAPSRDPRLENGLPPAPSGLPQTYGMRNVPQYDNAQTQPTMNIPPHQLNIPPVQYDHVHNLNIPTVPEPGPHYQQNIPMRSMPTVPPVVPPPTYVQINLTYKNPTTTSDGSPLERKVQNSDNASLLSDNESTASGVSAARQTAQKPVVPERSKLTPPLRPPPPPPVSSHVVPSYERPQSAAIPDQSAEPARPKSYARSKSEAVLETSFDADDEPNEPLTRDSRSQSQPLETAM